MGLTYKRGQTIIYYCSFVTLEGKEPGSINDPKITIRHVDDSFNVITDINEENMLFLAENTYYFKWSIPSNAYIGTYNAECQAVIDGEYAEHNETVKVIE